MAFQVSSPIHATRRYPRFLLCAPATLCAVPLVPGAVDMAEFEGLLPLLPEDPELG